MGGEGRRQRGDEECDTDARSNGREGRVYIRGMGEGEGKEEQGEEDDAAELISLRAVTDIGGWLLNLLCYGWDWNWIWMVGE